MKILVVHDEAGNIRSIGVPAGKPSSQARLHAPPGHVVSEVEVTELKDEQDHELLEQLRLQYRVQRGRSEAPHLVKR